MNSGIFDNGFGVELDKLIEKRLLTIENLEERKQTKDIMTEVFKELTHYTKEAYQELEQKLEHQLHRENIFTVTTGIIERDAYDVTNDEMYPMCEEDISEPELRVSELLECLQEGRAYFIYSIFVEADYKLVRQLANRREHFPCIIKTMTGEYRGNAYVEMQKKYFQVLNELFEVYQLNGIKWETVCAPYLYKMFDVYIDSADIPEDEAIEYITVDFGEYEPYVKYQMMPLWNIEKICITADLEPVPCVDRLHYRHMINQKRFEQGSEYLIAEKELQILEIDRGEQIEVVTAEKDIPKWNFYRITSKNTRIYSYPLMSNMQTQSERYIAKTLVGIYKRNKQLGYEEYVELKNVTFPKQYDEMETYSMDQYMVNEITLPKTEAIMLLEFTSKKKEHYLVKDIMSYLVTAIQREFREYRCVGKLD